jgi:hypothetical protein
MAQTRAFPVARLDQALVGRLCLTLVPSNRAVCRVRGQTCCGLRRLLRARRRRPRPCCLPPGPRWAVRCERVLLEHRLARLQSVAWLALTPVRAGAGRVVVAAAAPRIAQAVGELEQRARRAGALGCGSSVGLLCLWLSSICGDREEVSAAWTALDDVRADWAATARQRLQLPPPERGRATESAEAGVDALRYASRSPNPIRSLMRCGAAASLGRRWRTRA